MLWRCCSRRWVWLLFVGTCLFEGAFDAGELAVVVFGHEFSCLDLASRLDFGVRVAVRYGVVQRDHGRLEIGVRFVDAFVQQSQAFVRVASGRVAPSDRRVQRVHPVGQIVQLPGLGRVVVALADALTRLDRQVFHARERRDVRLRQAEPLVEAGGGDVLHETAAPVRDRLPTVHGQERAARAAVRDHRRAWQCDAFAAFSARQPHGHRPPGLLGDQMAVERDWHDRTVADAGHDVLQVVRGSEFRVADFEPGRLVCVCEVGAAQFDVDVVDVEHVHEFIEAFRPGREHVHAGADPVFDSQAFERGIQFRHRIAATFLLRSVLPV